MVSMRFAGLVALAAVGFSTGAEAARPHVATKEAGVVTTTILPPHILKDLLKPVEQSVPAECPLCRRPGTDTTASQG